MTGTGEIKTAVPTCQSVIAEDSTAKGDVKVKHGEKLKFGKFEIECRATPGHTDGKMLYVIFAISILSFFHGSVTIITTQETHLLRFLDILKKMLQNA